MFYTFARAEKDDNGNLTSSHPPEPGKRRRKIASACERCRLLRIRCGSRTPCSPCVSGKSRCKRSNLKGQARNLEQNRNHSLSKRASCGDESYYSSGLPSINLATPPETVSHQQQNVVDHLTRPDFNSKAEEGNHRTSSAPSAASVSSVDANKSNLSVHAATNASPPTTGSVSNTRSTSLASFVELASRALHQRPQDPLFIDYDSPISVYYTSSLESNAPPVTTLSRDEVDCMIDLYWQVLDLETPILDRGAFQDHYDSLWTADGRQHTASPLVDAVTALSSQYAHGTDLVFRIVSLRNLGCTYHNDVALAAFCYLRRCRKTLEDVGTVGEPSLTTVQTYTLMATYLLNAGQYDTAYTMIGLAIRIAYALALHQDLPAASMEPLEAGLTRRTWWTLVQLDMKCSQELGRPLAAHPSALSLSHSFPSSANHPDHPLTHIQYHEWRSKLTAAMLLVEESLARARNPSSTDKDRAMVEMDAEELERTLIPLMEWKREVMGSSSAITAPLTHGVHPPTDLHMKPAWEQRQIIQLSLYYHDALSRFYRPFISHAGLLCAPKSDHRRAPHIHGSARKCADHAMTILDILDTTMRSSDILYGWFGLYVLQWHAVLNLFTFVAVYPPVLEVTTVAVEKLDRALRIFEIGEHRHGVARRACALTRRLISRMIAVIHASGSAVAADTVDTTAEGATKKSPLTAPFWMTGPDPHPHPRHLPSQQPRENERVGPMSTSTVLPASQQQQPAARPYKDDMDDIWSWFDNLETISWDTYLPNLDESLNEAVN